MADSVQSNAPIQSNDRAPKTVKTFVSEIKTAMRDIPGVEKSKLDRLLESVGDSFQKFSKLPHTFPALSAFLHYHIAAIAYKFGNSPQIYVSVLTASPALVSEILKMTGSDGKVSRNFTISRDLFNPKSEHDKMITVFDVESRRLIKNFAPKEWMILPPPDGFLPLDPKIVDILQEALADIYNPNRKKERKKTFGQI